jgi:uncharacterized protein YegP (UPF0339 family)
MTKKKFPYILIKDAKGGFRTHIVGGNGEKVMTSEVLETPQAVKKNLIACELVHFGRIFHQTMSQSELFTNVIHNDIRYEGKSEAIYKMFKIEKG